ncbi:hypothetical protein BOTCAL_0563g00030 [Botryotinia calthae]|uniref:DUF676 domain-containing protein n=1 Tax=Botryotinia calthae TaxID=38488 RepID=A0A4Y8CJP8_9HELO|nr:hypothetical protein BOTCAL_0563g00030 [Botryotinia calthae]
MSRNSENVVCTVSGDRTECTDAIESIVRAFFGEHAKVIRKKSAVSISHEMLGSTIGEQNYDYELKLPINEAPEHEELQKVRSLCRVKVQDLWKKLDPSPNSDKGKRLVPPPSSDAEKIPQPAATKDRPDTIRVKNIPSQHPREFVEILVQREFHSKPKIHSLALHDRENLCATVTFPGEDYGFPMEQLPKVILARQSSSDVLKIQYDADFLSFTTLYNARSVGLQADVEYVYISLTQLAFMAEINCSIIAVVGLGTHAFGTFRSKTSGSHEMWLRDFLPQDIPNSRILLYGYDSIVSEGQSIETIEDIANTFLSRLSLRRQNTSTLKRPIIFIGQSLGGLVVQEALLKAENSRSPNEQETSLSLYERDIFDSWHGLVGFGIPIAGLHNPSLIEAVKSQPNKVLINQLCLDRENGTPSPYLVDLKRRFEDCCKRERRPSSHAPEVLYFWERHYTQPRTRNGIKGEKVIMVKDSNTPGARNLPSKSDHSGMVKYSSRSDPLYEDVSSNIKSMVLSLAERRKVVQSTSVHE